MPTKINNNDKPAPVSSAPPKKTKKPPIWALLAGYLALASIFGTSFVVIERPVPITMSFILAALSLLWMLFIQRGKVGISLVLISFLIFLHSAICIFFDTTSLALMGKVFASSLLFYLTFAMVISIFRHNITNLIRMYIFCCLIIAVIGLFQGISFLLHFRPGYDYSSFLNVWTLIPGGPLGIRLNSILAEPSQVAFTMGPAIALSLYRMLNKKPYYLSKTTAIIILLFALLSASSSVLVSLVLAFILVIRLSFTTLLKLIGLGTIFFTFLINSTYLEKSLAKLQGLRDLWRDGAEAESANATTYTLYVHFKTALENFKTAWGLGKGLGSHEYGFSYYVTEYEGLHNIWSISTAGNLTFRLISEFGMFGIFLMAGYLYLAISGILSLSAKHLLLHAALIASIGAFFIRNGTYAHFGLAFYILLLIINYHDGYWQAKQSSCKKSKILTSA